jgi:hypothetical protein
MDCNHGRARSVILRRRALSDSPAESAGVYLSKVGLAVGDQEVAAGGKA